jgi:hypothetical protein
MAVAGLIIVVVIGDAMLTAAFKSVRGPSIGVMTVTFAFLACEIGLLACWLAFGNYPLLIRLASIVPLSGLVFFPFFVEDGPAHEQFVAFAGCNLIVFSVAVLPLLMRVFGVRLVRLGPANEITPSPSDQKPLQFTLRQMFGWTLSVAIVAAVVRFVIPRDFHLEASELISVAMALLATFGIGGAAVCGTVWAALGFGRPVGRLLIVGGACFVISLMTFAAFHARDKEALLTSVAAGLGALLTGCVLLLWRAAGFRLIRARRNPRQPESHFQRVD